MTPLANQPAFPFDPQGTEPHSGMTLRQYYAGLAMQGLMSAYQSSEKLIGFSRDAEDHLETKVEETMARWAVDQADALIAALEKSQ